MFLRKISQQAGYHLPPDEAFEDARLALSRVGKVKSADEASGMLKGSVSGGGWVTLEITVSPAGDGSTFALVARCDDVWGSGARRGIEQFLLALPSRERSLATAVHLPSILKPPSLGDSLTFAQKISVGAFLAIACLGSLGVAWGRQDFPLSLAWLYLIASVLGAFAGLMIVKRRYVVIGVVSSR